MRFRPTILLFLGLFVFLSCTSTAPTNARDAGAPDAGPETPGFISLEVSPAALDLEPGQQELIQAFGISDDGTRKIVQDLRWLSDNENVVVVNAEGIVTAVDAGTTEVQALLGDLRATVQIRVVADLDQLPPRGLSYKSPVTYVAGQAIDPNTPNNQGGVPTRYQITPSLPAGLFIDEESGVISGTPRIPAARVVYTVSASNAGGSAVALVSLAVECDLNEPPSPNDDVPDALLQDSNGDGIDGVVCGPIFVATDGDDGAMGTMDAPVQTLNQAILLAKSYEPPRPIYVSKGEYEGRVTLSSGVNIYGGFDRSAGWSRDIESWPVVRSIAPALLAENLEVSSTISQMEFQADDANGGSAASYAALIQDCAAELRFERVVFRAGRGGDGLPGAAGWDGFWGEDATYGDSGCEPTWEELGFQICGSDPPCERPWYGQAGTSDSDSGSGGSGGYAGLADEPGEAGSAGAGGAGGGAGGVATVNKGRGGDGQAGAQGARGMNGAGGSAGQPGVDGQDGRPGEGGGGGGGGAGNGDYCDAYGGAGGGGGSGGEPGEGGHGGSSGGASIAVVVQNADIHLENVRLVPGAGGDGGAGGYGGYGGLGGLGGYGGLAYTDELPGGDSGAGGAGGQGGNGGDGGHGGGGGGGNSIAVVADDLERVNVVDTEFETGAGGEGGGGPGVPGGGGQVLDYWEGSFSR